MWLTTQEDIAICSKMVWKRATSSFAILGPRLAFPRPSSLNINSTERSQTANRQRSGSRIPQTILIPTWLQDLKVRDIGSNCDCGESENTCTPTRNRCVLRLVCLRITWPTATWERLYVLTIRFTDGQLNQFYFYTGCRANVHSRISTRNDCRARRHPVLP
jgi:hypothetical protein